MATRADRDGDDWVINGQKVWSSGAQFSAWGELIARTDFDAPKHKGMTAFMLPLDAPGVEVRPLRQMSGGSSFNEVFMTDVRIPDSYRIGDIGEGWRVALTTLGFERSGSDGGNRSDVWPLVRMVADEVGDTKNPLLRQSLAGLYTHLKLMSWNNQRTTARAEAGETPGPEGSIGKLFWVQSMLRTSDVMASILGPNLTADSGEWGTFTWNEQLLGAPGYRIAGGSDEIQRNIIGERVLGLPREPRVDRDVPFNEIPR